VCSILLPVLTLQSMGQNPTSGLLSVHRRKQIYALCQKFDILIIEDDPYWYLQYPSANALSLQKHGKPVSTNHPTTPTNYNTFSGGKSSGFPFLDSLVPSYLSVDTDGRVVRLDTFSKTIAPGCRLGWITTQPAFVDRIQRITETTTQQPSGFVQSLVAELILGPSDSADDPGKGGSKDGSGWKADGWVRWLEGLRGNYERRMQVMASILDDGMYLTNSHPTPTYPAEDADFEVITKTQLYDFAYPMAGMFLWLRAHFETHNLYKKCGGPKLAQALWVFMTTEDYRVLLAPGGLFSPTEEIREEKGWQYFRLCFAAVDDDVVKTSSEGFVKCVHDFWGIEDAKEIDELVREGEEEVSEVVGQQMVSFDVVAGWCVCANQVDRVLMLLIRSSAEKAVEHLRSL
jgi:DNA-binding transcriptional MocR family regulator